VTSALKSVTAQARAHGAITERSAAPERNAMIDPTSLALESSHASGQSSSRTSVLELDSSRDRVTRRALDYLTLTKPRIGSMVALSAFIGGLNDFSKTTESARSGVEASSG